MWDYRAQSLVTLRETLRVAQNVYATAVALGFVDPAQFEAGAIAKLETTIRQLESSVEPHQRHAMAQLEPPPRGQSSAPDARETSPDFERRGCW